MATVVGNSSVNCQLLTQVENSALELGARTVLPLIDVPAGSSLPEPFDLPTDPQVAEPQLGRGGLGLVPRKTAVLLIEVQNEFMTPGGKLHETVRPVMDQINMMSNCLRLCNELSK